MKSLSSIYLGLFLLNALVGYQVVIGGPQNDLNLHFMKDMIILIVPSNNKVIEFLKD